MKAFRYITAVATIMTLAACQNDDLDLGGYENDSDAVRINATVGSLIESRSNPITSSAFEDDDKITLRSEGQSVEYTYDKFAPDGPVWTADGGKFLKWIKPTQKFTAYFPSDYTGSESVRPDQSGKDWSDDNYIGKSDYMYFEGDCNKPAQAPYTINLEMQRQTARVVVDGGFSYNNELESLEGYTITLTISDGTTTVQPCLSNGRYYALLNPTTTANAEEAFVTITLTKGEETKKYIVRGVPVLEKGYSYTYNITIGKDKVEIGEVEVAPWTDGGVIEGNEHQTEEDLGGYTLSYSNGASTYTVYTTSGLQEVNRIITSDNSKLNSNIKLAADIILTGENNWIPIGNANNWYTGTFDGNNHTIYGLNINQEFAGLIGYLDASGKVQNLIVEGCDVTGSLNTGAIVGYNVGTIENCIVQSSAAYSCNIESNNYVGVIVGSNRGVITKCQVLSTSGAISAKTSSQRVGGIVGYTGGNNITDCHVVVSGGNITLENTRSVGQSHVGGIAGCCNTYYASSAIEGCTASGVTLKALDGGGASNASDHSRIGGIVGMVYAISGKGNTVTACSAKDMTLTVTNRPENAYFGGIAGEIGPEDKLIGCYAYNCTPDNVFGNGAGTFAECYYAKAGSTSVTYYDGTLSTWEDAVSAMNGAISGWTWGGTYDAPTLTER